MFRLPSLLLLLIPAFSRADEPVTFRGDVMAVLSRTGCNSGACHGNLNGKGGLRLSLRGEDADFDLAGLTRGMMGRRTDTQNPNASLILQKVTGLVPHEGGIRFGTTSKEYSILHEWISNGCIDKTIPKLTKLELNVTQRILPHTTDKFPIEAMAHFANGTKRNVTHLATFEITSLGVLNVKTDGTVVREQPGETTIIVRYLDRQVPIRVTFLPDRPVPDLSKFNQTHSIDKVVAANWKQLRIEPSRITTDSEFIRRVYLDTCGIIPTVGEVREFLADVNPDKRNKLIDKLLERPEFASYWTQKWGDLLRNEEKSLDRKGVQVFHRWIRNWIAADKPLNDMAREILAARGSTYEQPQANFYRSLRDPYSRAESSAQVFLGLRVSCAKCHNHPFDVWTQDDYHRFSAIFARIDYRILSNTKLDALDKHEFIGEQIVMAKLDGELPHPRGGNAEPKFLGTTTPELKDRLDSLADWVAAKENPFFAKAQANRIWAHLMGRGIVEPIDDFKVANPPTNPELLDLLTQTFRDGGFRLKSLVKFILTSQTYQLASTSTPNNAEDQNHYSHGLVQPLEAEQLLDALANATGSPLKITGYPQSMRAGEIPATPLQGRRLANDNNIRFLRVFGKPERLLTCECERNDDPGMLQAFQMITGKAIQEMIANPNNRLGKLLEAQTSDASKLEELYLGTLARPPTEKESTKLLLYVQNAKDRRSAWEDILWGLVNAKEFLLRQ